MKKLVYFKVVYTTKTTFYEIDTTWTLLQLYNHVKSLIFNDFHIRNFELLDTFTHFDGKSEEKPKIELNNSTIEEFYGDNIDFTAIYIRPI